MKPSHIRKVLDQIEKSVAFYNLFDKFSPAKDISMLRDYYKGCMREDAIAVAAHLPPDTDLTKGQLYELYAQIILRERHSNRSVRTIEVINNLIKPFETYTDLLLRRRLEKIKELGCLPETDKRNINYELLSLFLFRLPINLFQVKFLKNIFDAFYQREFPDDGFIKIITQGMLNEENFNALGDYFGYATPHSLGAALDKIPVSLFSQRKFDELKAAPDLCFVLCHLRNSFITVATYELIRDEYLPILRHAHLDKMPPLEFTEARFKQIMEYCKNANGNLEAARLTIRDYIYKIARLPNPAGALDFKDNTHTKSVNITVSKTAIAFMKRYGQHINTEEKLQKVLNEIDAFLIQHQDDYCGPESGYENRLLFDETGEVSLYAFQIEKARQAFTRLSNPNYAFKDPLSKITTRQFIALTRLAILDDTLRGYRTHKEAAAHNYASSTECTLADAERKFVIAFYDMQRGDNLQKYYINDKGIYIDNKLGSDLYICETGNFNKTGEVTWGIHPDNIMKFLVMSLASSRLPKLVREVTLNYLTQAKGKSLTYARALGKQIDSAKSLEPIWHTIQKHISLSMHKEYGSLFTNDSSGFQQFIETGKATNVADLLEDLNLVVRHKISTSAISRRLG